MAKIAHIADTHIRNLKYHYEYKIIFSQLYETLKNEKVDYIVHCGDIAHTKTQISPEFVDMATDFFYNLAEIAPTYIILGNHDGNLKNSSRQDAISPIVNALNHKSLHLLKDAGEFPIDKKICLNVLSVFDEENWTAPTDESRINIALYHGSIRQSKTDTGFRMTHGDHEIDIFEDFDYAMLGDIHKAQILDNDGRVRYAGSTVQQNFGETDDKGILIWNIKSKDKFDVKHVAFKNPRPFITISLDEKGKFETEEIPSGARLRLVADRSLSIDVMKKAIDIAKHKFNPESVTFLNRATERSSVDTDAIDDKLDLRDLKVQEELVREYLEDYNLSEDEVENVLQLNRKYDEIVQQGEDVSRNINWRLDKFQWNNLFNFGTDNEIDFNNLNGIVGIFGKNFSGKSSIIDSILYTMFNSTSKNERKNLNVINQNRDKGFAKLDILVNDIKYSIERESEKYTKRLKGEETREAKTNVNFSAEDATTGEVAPLNGLTRNDTDKIIRNHFGTLEDFLLTSMSSQHGALNFISEGSSKRKEIFAKFLDLELFESKFKLAKEDSADIRALLKKMESRDYREEIKVATTELAKLTRKLNGHEKDCIQFSDRIEEMESQIAVIDDKINSIPAKIIDITKVKKQIRNKNVDIQELSEHKESLIDERQEKQDLYAKICDFVDSFDIDAVQKDKVRIDDLSEQILNFQAQFDNKVRERDVNESRKKLLEGIPCGTSFPSCKFIKDANISVKHLPVIKQEIEQTETHLQSLRNGLRHLNPEQVESHLSKYQQLLDRKVELSSRITEIGLQLDRDESTILLTKKEIQELQVEQRLYEDNKEAIENLEALLSEKESIQKTIQGVRRSLVVCEKKRLELYKKNGSLEERVNTVQAEQAEFKELQASYSAYDLYMQCMHSNGIAFDVIKRKLPIINSEITKTISNIVDFEVFFEVDGNKFDIFIKHPKHEPRPLEMGSGAEKTIAAMAIRMALLTVSSMPKGDIFILDEPGTALDEENMEGFIRMLELIKVHFNTVLLISHLDSLKDCVDMQIVIDRKDNFAYVKQ